MAGVVLAGLYEPGSVVGLFPVKDGQLRAIGDAVQRRQVDQDGNVGFDELEDGHRYIAAGYLNGVHQEIRVLAREVLEHHRQAPIAPVLPSVGTQEDKQVPVPPAEPGEALPTGVPEALTAAAPIADSAPTASSEPDPTPAVTSAAPGAAVGSEAQPVQPDVQGQQTVPSESAGVAEGAGSPSKAAEASASADTAPSGSSPAAAPPAESPAPPPGGQQDTPQP